MERDQDPLGPSSPRHAAALAFVGERREWVAWRLGFQNQLGRPGSSSSVGRFISRPPSSGGGSPRRLRARHIHEGAYVAASGGIAAVVVAIAMSVWRAREMKRVTTYGSARWAERGSSRGRPARPRRRVSAAGATTICAMMAPSMSCVSRQPDPAKASVSSSRRFSRGPARQSSTTSRAKTGL